MPYKQNLHAHNHYCDGRDTFGSSWHAYQYFSPVYTISPEDTVKYKAEIAALKTKYTHRIRPLAGLEIDMYVRPDTAGLDYIICSSHFLRFSDEFAEFDKKVSIFREIPNKYFDGNAMKFLRKYYEDFAVFPVTESLIL